VQLSVPWCIHSLNYCRLVVVSRIYPKAYSKTRLRDIYASEISVYLVINIINRQVKHRRAFLQVRAANRVASAVSREISFRWPFNQSVIPSRFLGNDGKRTVGFGCWREEQFVRFGSWPKFANHRILVGCLWEKSSGRSLEVVFSFQKGFPWAA
jgi:hypothetical protein